MNPTDDPLYRVHQLQACRRRRPALDYSEFRRRVGDRTDTDLSELFEWGDVWPNAIFHPGPIYATPWVMYNLDWGELMSAVQLHTAGNWGEISPKQWLTNDLALAKGGSICSVHRDVFGVKFWVITQGDPRYTMIMMPSDAPFSGDID